MKKSLLVALVAASAAAGAVSSVQVIPGARVVRAAGAGTVYFVSYQRSYPATTTAFGGAECALPFSQTLSRLDLATGKVSWTACLPLASTGVALDIDRDSGAPVVAGIPSAGFRVSGGGFGEVAPYPAVPSGIAVIRMRADGTAPEWASAITNPGRAFVEPGGVRMLRDGSIFVIGTARAPGLPVTENAIDLIGCTRGCGYMARIAADGSKLLFASYLSRAMAVWQLEIHADGTAAIAGATTEPVGLKLNADSISPAGERLFIARFDTVAARFRRFTPTDMPAAYRSRMALTPDGRVAVVLSGLGLATIRLARINADASTAEVTQDLYVTADYFKPPLLELSGNAAIVGVNGDRVPPPFTSSSARRELQEGGSAVLGIDLDSDRVLFSHHLAGNGKIESIALAGDVLVVGCAAESTQLSLPAAEPLSADTAVGVMLAAHPNVRQDCWVMPPPAALFWDFRGMETTARIQVRRDAPDGVILATGATGAVAVPLGHTYYLVADSNAGPFARPRVLASEVTSAAAPFRCGGMGRSAAVIVHPNPVLACADAPYLGTETTVTASGAGYGGEIHVGGPGGPLLAFHPHGSVSARTGDWVRNGMEFVLTEAREPRTALASNRAYILPVRACQRAVPEFGTAIRAVRDCVKTDLFTLAYYAREATAVEIRSDAPEGTVVARLRGPSGLVDVSTQRATTYYLMSFENGAWKQVASTTADQRQPCEQGYLR